LGALSFILAAAALALAYGVYPAPWQAFASLLVAPLAITRLAQRWRTFALERKRARAILSRSGGYQSFERVFHFNK
jgi:hypothetical protein